MANSVRQTGLAKFMRVKMRDPRTGNSAFPKFVDKQSTNSNLVDVKEDGTMDQGHGDKSLEEQTRVLDKFQKLVHEAIQLKKKDITDLTLGQIRQDYHELDWGTKKRALLVLATQYGVDRANVRDLISHYLTLQNDKKDQSNEFERDHEGISGALYRAEHELRSALTPLSSRFFEWMNWQPGGLKFLVDLRADLRTAIEEQNLASLRALDIELKEMLATWLSPAGLELHQITWSDSASLLEKIVAYEAVHPISNLYDLKRRLGIGRRCFGYFHPSIPGEPLIFIEAALTKTIVESIQEVLWDEPPISESEATTALFYSISSTQPGLVGINLGKFLIKRVVRLLQQEMPSIQTFGTLSPIPGFLHWLLPKLASQAEIATFDSTQNQRENADKNTLKEDVLFPFEKKMLLEASGASGEDNNALHILWNLLTSTTHKWAKSENLVKAMQPIMLRLCARYILKEKKRNRALDPVTNFHAQNGANVERLNWMGDRSEQGLTQSAGIMVNYLYRLEKIEDNSQLYFDKGVIPASPAVEAYLKPQ